MKKIKYQKIIIGAVVGIIIFPLISSAAWWNPLSWGGLSNQNTQPTTQNVIPKKNKTTATKKVTKKSTNSTTTGCTSTSLYNTTTGKPCDSTITPVSNTTAATVVKVQEQPDKIPVTTIQGTNAFDPTSFVNRPFDPEFEKLLNAEGIYITSTKEKIDALRKDYNSKVFLGLSGKLGSLKKTINRIDENYGNYSMMLNQATVYYDNGELTSAKFRYNGAILMRTQLSSNITLARTMLSDAVETTLKYPVAIAGGSTAALKFGCAVTGQQVCSWAIVKPLDFAIDYATEGLDIAKRNAAC